MNKQEAPRQDNPTTSKQGVRTQLLSEPQDRLTTDTLLSHLMHIEAKDVTLKFVFDHARNYAICVGLAIAGVKAIKLKVATILAVPQLLGGGTLVLVAMVLFALNFVHGVTAVSRIRNVTTISKVAYFATTALVFLSVAALAAASAA